MDFAADQDTARLQEKLRAFLSAQVVPADATFERQLSELDNPWA
jgi:hypothetical protein